MINPGQNFEVPLHDHKINALCAITGIIVIIIEPIFFEQTIYSEFYANDLHQLFLRELLKNKGAGIA
jgi:hypothetical protein